MSEETKDEKFERRLNERFSDPDLIVKKLKDHKKLAYRDKQDKVKK